VGQCADGTCLADGGVSADMAWPPSNSLITKVNALAGERQGFHVQSSFIHAEFSHEHSDVPLGLDVVSAPLYGAICIDDKGGAGAAHVLLSVILLEAPCSKGVVQRQIFIHEKREIEILLADKSLMGFLRIFGYTKHDAVIVLKAGHVVPKVARLCGAAGG
jgi:hypothetical protein